MKKLFALILALLLALSCTSAFARTVYTKVTVDREQMGKLLAGFGIPEAQVSMADPILSLVNALGVRVTTVQNGAQVDLDLNGKDALSLGLAMDGEGVGIVSTLFPNYYLTLSNDTIYQMMAHMSPPDEDIGIGQFFFCDDILVIFESCIGKLQRIITLLKTFRDRHMHTARIHIFCRTIVTFVYIFVVNKNLHFFLLIIWIL